ncbi:DUF2806 domain-containing protein [Xanthomonas sp. LMG 8993]|uniref:DUF2806 domain-containing protein n=1 Tax=Xanthomonas TaxID=338 RepID=UPI00136C3A8F|nr:MULTISPECIES: DUF2806 domain-containing protein [Xanthomonas]MBB4767565.1 hypothetical protein [Xanthomonas arboricola]MXV47831.1 DUF2806 domain-containing protein [Xanthomonas sp. LMG 8993]
MDPVTTTAAKWTAALWKAVGGGIISGILKPGQVRREGMASIDVEFNKKLALTQAEVYAQDIIAGRKSYSMDEKRLISHDISQLFSNQLSESTAEPQSTAQLSSVLDVMAANTLKREINVAKAALHAEEEFEGETCDPPEQPPSEDWLTRWRDSAEKVSEDEMQRLWGRILAGEIKQPGTYSLRALEVIRNLSKEDADLIANISNFRSNDVIFKPESDDFFNKKGLSFAQLMELQDLGLIAGVESMGLSIQITSQSATPLQGEFVFHNYVVRFSSQDIGKRISVPVYTVSKMGRQIIGLAKPEDDPTYICLLRDYLIRQDCQSSIHEIIEFLADGNYRYKRDEVVF